jgi:hypothetical protein
VIVVSGVILRTLPEGLLPALGDVSITHFPNKSLLCF